MSAPTSYVICHDCKEVTSTTAVAEVRVPPRYGVRKGRAKMLRAFVCRVCYDLEYNPSGVTPFVPVASA